VWKKMGSPQTFTLEQFAELEKSGHLAELEDAKDIKADHGKLNLHIVLPRQAVSLLALDYSAQP